METYGAATVCTGESRIELYPDNQVVIGEYSNLTAYGDLNLTAGQSASTNIVAAADDYTVEARWDGFAGSVIPIDDVDALAFIVQENRITVAAGADVHTARQANLYAEGESVVDIIGKAKVVSWVSEAADAIGSLLGGGGEEQFAGHFLAESHGTVEVDGTVETGLTRHQALTITGLNWILVGVDPETGSNVYNPTVVAEADRGITFSVGYKTIESKLVMELHNAERLYLEFKDANATWPISISTRSIASRRSLPPPEWPWKS